MFTFVDDLLNRVTMYRLVLYYLIVLLLAAAVYGFFGVLPFSPANLMFSTVLILGVSWVFNKLFAKVFRAAANFESLYITGLILALIISPVAPTDYAGVGFLIFAAAWAMASKFIFAFGKKHIFNPAAFGVALAALTINQGATWWVAGNMALMPIVVLGGLLIVRKLRRFDLVFAFAIVSLATIVLTATNGDYARALQQTLLHSSFFFLAFVMLTEPLTMPPDRWRRVLYGALVGFFFAPNVHLGSFYFTPELALLIGNVFSYVVSPKGRFMLTLLEKNKLGEGVYEFAFATDRRFGFKPGQYLEWTLEHKYPDNRGNRRYFTIASAPGEETVNLGVKFYEPMSTFKRALMSMKEGDTLSASHIAGDFTLPKDPKRKFVFIAGGIGVTPFRSMVKHMIDTNDTRPTAILYANKTASEVAYKDLFDEAQQKLGAKVVYALSDERAPVAGYYSGKIDAALIAKEVPDYRDRTFYISGPHGMVEAFKDTLSQMGVPRWHIKVDFFPGFA